MGLCGKPKSGDQLCGPRLDRCAPAACCAGMVFLRALMESRPYFTRVPDQSLIADNPIHAALHMQATRDTNGRYAFVYFPAADLTARLELGQLHAARIRAWWYEPRTGVGTLS